MHARGRCGTMRGAARARPGTDRTRLRKFEPRWISRAARQHSAQRGDFPRSQGPRRSDSECVWPSVPRMCVARGRPALRAHAARPQHIAHRVMQAETAAIHRQGLLQPREHDLEDALEIQPLARRARDRVEQLQMLQLRANPLLRLLLHSRVQGVEPARYGDVCAGPRLWNLGVPTAIERSTSSHQRRAMLSRTSAFARSSGRRDRLSRSGNDSRVPVSRRTTGRAERTMWPPAGQPATDAGRFLLWSPPQRSPSSPPRRS